MKTIKLKQNYGFLESNINRQISEKYYFML